MRGWPWDFIQVCWGVWIVLWLVMAAFTKRTVERPERAWSLASGVVLALVYVVFRTHVGNHRPLYATTTGVGEASDVVVAAGLAFTAWARLTLGGNWSGSIVFKEGHELVQNGPYALVRHPIYTGLLAMALGTSIDYAEPLGYFVFAAICVVLWGKLTREERLMTSHFPDVYPDYRRRVKALIPFVL